MQVQSLPDRPFLVQRRSFVNMDAHTCSDAEDYEILVDIGEGAYGKVYKARETKGQQRLVALKKLNIPNDLESGIPAFMIREVALLRKMEYFNHPNIVKLLNVSAILRNRTLDLTLVFEYIDQDLSTFLASAPSTGLSREKIKDVMRQLLHGLDFLHTNMLVHRDLKPDNVLVSSRGEVKIADFGLSRIYTYHIALTPCVVTLWYRAPEVLLHSGYMPSVDIWSAGCIFAELFLLREEDWPVESPISYSSNWGTCARSAQLLPNLSQQENDLLSQCLTFNPTKRISASRALAHSFLAGP
ncbi:hypothetical protein MATL_G00213960 [Megalops atlanticus]|uniref:cyclin-dependent kinase n=1 Tax=Megalops atlanticus TaxID=7932 RepID=A0A9D3SXR2_MEGAT|nr:hypothetical protein MATL_G00213960 [Megalops atlanticus]